MSQNVDGMVRAGVDAYRAGNKAEARALLERAIEIDSYNETAWLWLSAVVDTPEEQQTCLENVLIINPENSRARQGLKSLGVDPDAVIAAAQTDDDVDDYVPETSSEPTGDWVDNLNIGGNKTPVDTEDSDLFGDVDFSDDGGAFNLDNNIFTEDLFDDIPSGYDDSSYDDDLGYDLEADSGGYIDDSLFDDGGFDDGDDMFADIGTLENYTDAVGDDLAYDDSQFMGDPFAEPEPEAVAQKPAAKPELSNEELLRRIPKEIEPTRAPGVDEKVPQFHYIILGVLGVVNVGALIFVGLQFLG